MFKKVTFSIFFLALAMLTQAQNFDIEGHRGCRGLMPENTIEAFIKALDLGVNTLELDVCISKDKKVVVSHEPYFHANYCSHPDGKPVKKSEEKSLNLHLMTYDEIKRYDTGKRGNAEFPEQQKIPTYKPLLSEVFIACEAYIKKKGLKSVRYNIEIKSEEKEYGVSQPATVAEFTELVYQEITKYIKPNRIILQSFDFNVLKHWKQQTNAGRYQKVTLSALVTMKGPEKTVEELGFQPDVFSSYFKFLTENKVKFCHEKGIKVVPWTVNEIDDMKKIKAIGSDGLITDYPDRAKSIGL